MAPKPVLAVVACACAALVAFVTPVTADQYRAGELLTLDLSKAVLSPKRIGPPTEFAPVAVQARTDARQAFSESKPAPRKPPVAQVRVEKPREVARSSAVRRNPLDAQAMDTRIQTWPCKSGGICDWKR